MSPELSQLARFFKHPRSEYLRPDCGLNGVACVNVRRALNMLGYGVEPGDMYDDLLADVVRRFQRDNDHGNADGWVGPGTRRLIAQRLLAEASSDIFTRFVAPRPGGDATTGKKGLPRSISGDP